MSGQMKRLSSHRKKNRTAGKEFKENFISNSDRILSQGELIEEQREELQQLTLRIEDVETLLDEVSSEAYDKAVDKVAEETMRATRKMTFVLRKILRDGFRVRNVRHHEKKRNMR